jgi:RNA recognition motif-containing protein
MSSPNIDPTTRLFVGGMPYKFTEGELLTLFAPFGRVVSLKIMHTAWGKSRGIGYVEFDNLESSIAAKKALHNHRVSAERTIIVDYALPDPLTTPDGRQRHDEKLAKKEARFARFSKVNHPATAGLNPDRDNPASTVPFKRKPVFGQTRQSVYDSRSHHSNVGAKFAKRTKKK